VFRNSEKLREVFAGEGFLRDELREPAYTRFAVRRCGKASDFRAHTDVPSNGTPQARAAASRSPSRVASGRLSRRANSK